MKAITISPEELMRMRLIFNHLPKCGGTSLIDLFAKIFGERACYRAKIRGKQNKRSILRLDNLTDGDLKQIRFVSGHFQYGHHERIKKFGDPVYYITVVRDPLERIVSAYNYNYSSGPEVLMKRARSMSLDDWILDTLKRPKSQVASGGSLVTLTGTRDLSDAKNIVDNEYFLACTNDQLDSMQRILTRLYDRNDLAPVRRNITKKSFSNGPSSEVVSIFEEECSDDIEIVKYIGQKFDALSKEFSI
jgi:hypothetical protein